MSIDTTTYCGAPHCGKPSPSATICPDCHNELDNELDNAAWLIDQLRNTATGQVRFGGIVGGKSNETPLPFNPKASAELAAYEATIQLWQGRLADHLGQPLRFTNAPAAAYWMAAQITNIHTYIDAGRLLDSLTYAREHIEHVINRPPMRKYLGDCGTTEEGHTCPGRMYARTGQTEAKCDTCGHTTEAATLELVLLRRLDDKILSAAEIARVGTYMGLTINREQVRKRINQWHKRDRITARDHVGDYPRFRFLEVRLLLEQDEETRRAG